MTNEKRDNNTESAQKRPQKPVVVYIMILFIAAFLLMGLSLLMHQRSNTEALGQLQSSVSAMKDIQAVQDKVIELQDQLSDAEEQISQLEDQIAQVEQQKADVQDTLDKSTLETKALLKLYTLQQQYSGKNYEACQQTMNEMEQENLLLYLPQTVSSSVTPPAFRYQQLKEAVLKQLYPTE